MSKVMRDFENAIQKQVPEQADPGVLEGCGVSEAAEHLVKYWCGDGCCREFIVNSKNVQERDTRRWDDYKPLRCPFCGKKAHATASDDGCDYDDYDDHGLSGVMGCLWPGV